MSTVPLVRWLSKCNVASRTEARRLVQEGRVRVDGRVCRDGARAIDGDRHRVEVDGRVVRAPDPARDFVWMVLNKPRGVVSTTADPEGRETVMDLIPGPHPPGLAPVGRLDRASAGVLLLTNDAEGAARLLDPERHVAKAYRVKVRGHPTPATLARWRTEAATVDGLRLGPMEVEVERAGPRSTWLGIVLREGKNRQIRRRCAADGHAVEVLVRTAFGPVVLGALPKGEARWLGAAEIAALARAARAGGSDRIPG